MRKEPISAADSRNRILQILTDATEPLTATILVRELGYTARTGAPFKRVSLLLEELRKEGKVDAVRAKSNRLRSRTLSFYYLAGKQIDMSDLTMAPKKKKQPVGYLTEERVLSALKGKVLTASRLVMAVGYKGVGGTTAENTHLMLAQLASEGKVRIERVGQRTYYTLNNQELLTEQVERKITHHLSIRPSTKRDITSSVGSPSLIEAVLQMMVKEGKIRKHSAYKSGIRYALVTEDRPIPPRSEPTSDGPIIGKVKDPSTAMLVLQEQFQAGVAKDVHIIDGKQVVVVFPVTPDTPRCARCGNATNANQRDDGFKAEFTAPKGSEQLDYDILCGVCQIQFDQLSKLAMRHVQATFDTFRSPVQ